MRVMHLSNLKCESFDQPNRSFCLTTCIKRQLEGGHQTYDRGRGTHSGSSS